MAGNSPLGVSGMMGWIDANSDTRFRMPSDDVIEAFVEGLIPWPDETNDEAPAPVPPRAA
jgi:hypothetical protein